MLTPEQISRYRTEGFVVVPQLFTAREIDAMKAELTRVQSIDTDHLVRERQGGTAKTIYRVHDAESPTASPVFHAVARGPRLLRAAQELLGTETLYIHHTKCNLKSAIDGSVWQWHQDYGAWKRDGIARPDMLTALVMLDPATEFNGCLYFIPGSQNVGDMASEMDDRTTSYKLWVVPKPELIRAMEQYPEPVPIVGKPGDVVFFHCNILHASGHNLSRHDRWHVYYVYNRCDNPPLDVPNPRPEYVRSVRTTPLVPGVDTLAGVTS